MAISSCRINLFGDLTLDAMGASVSQFRTHQIAVLLGTLAFYSHRRFRRDELIEMIWPECEPESGRNRLRIALTYLRKDLAGVRAQNGLLASDRAHVQLDPALYHTDKTVFEECLRAAAAASDPEQQQQHLLRALALYAGELLPGYEEAWIPGERERLRAACVLALRKMVVLHAKSGRTAEALEVALRAVALDPLNEELHRAVMQLHLVAHNPAAALQQYDRLERLLREQLRAVPSERIRQLAMECRQQGSATAPVSTAVSASIPLIPLIPLVTPVSAAMAAETEPEPAAPLPPGRVAPEPPTGRPERSDGISPPRAQALPLPLLALPLYGREAAIAAVRAMLARPDARLVTLVGPGGIGKTSLALAVAANVADLFDAPIAFVPLADLSDAKLIPEAVAKALRLPHADPQLCLDEIAAYAAGRTLLLILDNFEHLAANGAAVVQELLGLSPGLRCLATSRQRLRLAAEIRYVVPPLPTPAPDDSPAVLTDCSSVQLFMDRAQRCRSGFALSATNAADIAEICRRLDGIPLGIELAASWVQVFTPPQILARFQDRFIDLSSRQRGAAARHKSLRTVLQGSCELLSAEARQLFAALSVFRGAYGLEAIEAVFPHPELHELLAELMDQSLLSLRDAEDDNRFFLLEPLREFAATLPTQEEREQAAMRHATHYLDRIEAEDARLRGPETVAALDALDLELANIRAALERFATHPVLGLQLAGAMWRYWYLRGQYREGLDWLELALGAAPAEPSSARPRALRGAANLAFLGGDYAAAQTHHEAALALQRESGDRRSVASTLSGLGSVVNELGDHARALALQEESLRLYHELNDRRGTALVLGNLAAVHTQLGDAETACRLHDESAALLRELGALDSLVNTLRNLGDALWRRGEMVRARTVLQEGLQLCRDLANRDELARYLEVYGSLALHDGRMARAAALFSRGDTIRREVSAPRRPAVQAEFLADCGRVRAALGEAAFAEAWAHGAALDDEEAVTLAQSD